MSIIKEGGKIEYPQPTGTMSDNNEQKAKQIIDTFHVRSNNVYDREWFYPVEMVNYIDKIDAGVKSMNYYYENNKNDLGFIKSDRIAREKFIVDVFNGSESRINELQSENTDLKLEVEKLKEALNMIQTECNNSDIAFNISIDRIETILYNVFNP